MTLAKIFNPIRSGLSASAGAATASPSRPAEVTEPDRTPRMGTPPVTNTSPSGPSVELSRIADEANWLAMLEIVFEETGWPDA